MMHFGFYRRVFYFIIFYWLGYTTVHRWCSRRSDILFIWFYREDGLVAVENTSCVTRSVRRTATADFVEIRRCRDEKPAEECNDQKVVSTTRHHGYLNVKTVSMKEFSYYTAKVKFFNCAPSPLPPKPYQ